MGRRQLIQRGLALTCAAAVIAWTIVEVRVGSMQAFSNEHDSALKAPRKYRTQLNASMRFFMQRKFAFALAYAQRAIELEPGRTSAYVNAAAAAAKLGAWELLYGYQQKAYALWPTRQMAENLIFACEILGKIEEAAALERRLPELSDDLPINDPFHD
jgi:tetratricopeptide (TPR) repeat protein